MSGCTLLYMSCMIHHLTSIIASFVSIFFYFKGDIKHMFIKPSSNYKIQNQKIYNQAQKCAKANKGNK